MYLGKLAKAGIIKLTDITNAQGDLREWKELKESFPVLTASDYLRLAGLISSLPTDWKIAVRSQNLGSRPQATQNQHFDPESIKKIYSKIVCTRAVKPTAQTKYEELYPNFDFKLDEIYNRSFKTTIDCKTREFQYKILNRIL